MIDLLRIIKLVSIPKWGESFARDCFDYIGLAIYAIFGGTYLSKGIILQIERGLGTCCFLYRSSYKSGALPFKRATVRILTQLMPDILPRLKIQLNAKQVCT